MNTKAAEVADIAGVSADGAWRGLRVRVGLHTGAVLSDCDPTTKRIDYFGHSVNLSARVESQAEGGEIVISQVRKAGLPLEFLAKRQAHATLVSLNTWVCYSLLCPLLPFPPPFPRRLNHHRTRMTRCFGTATLRR